MYQKMSELNNIVHGAGFALVEVSKRQLLPPQTPRPRRYGAPPPTQNVGAAVCGEAIVGCSRAPKTLSNKRQATTRLRKSLNSSFRPSRRVRWNPAQGEKGERLQFHWCAISHRLDWKDFRITGASPRKPRTWLCAEFSISQRERIPLSSDRGLYPVLTSTCAWLSG
jgi:hypothetical protein